MQDRDQQSSTSRRGFLGLSGAALVACLLPAQSGQALEAASGPHTTSNMDAAQALLERVLGAHAKQIRLKPLSHQGAETFSISGTSGEILVEGTSTSALLMGVSWYLKYVAGVSVTWNGDSLAFLPAKLPAPSSPIRQKAGVQHRFALNDTNDGYTGPYWTWEQWERLIDVLALHGINEVLVYMGAEAVYQKTFREFGYSNEELRAWFPTPAHQPWWLLQNMSGWVGPSVSQELIDKRLALASRITGRLRSLAITPVLPGYFGTVPDGFAAKQVSARIVPQGHWLGLKRPDWLDPTCELFPQVAAAYYGAQQELLGPSTMFKMDCLHEGGLAGNVSLTRAAESIEAQLQKAHPGALWAILGWWDNPKHELLAGIKDKKNALILDGVADRYAYQDREQQWDNTPYALGAIWNFGGQTKIGANLEVWNERYFHQLSKPDSKLNGIAVMPEASCNNPAAFGFLTELAWRTEKVDVPHWFSEWSSYRYGGKDASAGQAWEIIHSTAYASTSGKWSESHDNLFSAQPSLLAKSACNWGPQEPRYDLARFSGAIHRLLQVHPRLRTSSAYRYDLVDVARQTVANRSRLLLPQINSAYNSKNIQQFRQLTQQWLEQIALLDRITGTDPGLLLGRWLEAAKTMAQDPAERAQLEFDARSLLLEWGPPASRDSGVHDYANREWQGLLQFYGKRWAAYFSMLDTALEKGGPVTEIDWFAMNQDWAKQTDSYPLEPHKDAYEVIGKAFRRSS